MSTQLSDFSLIFPEDLIHRAYISHGELAWTKIDALEAIARLEKSGVALLGVEVWVRSQSGPQMTGRYWSANSEVASGHHQSAFEFVASFRWGSYDDTLTSQDPYFNLNADRAAL